MAHCSSFIAAKVQAAVLSTQVASLPLMLMLLLLLLLLLLLQ
jgi:hypothetical protein